MRKILLLCILFPATVFAVSSITTETQVGVSTPVTQRTLIPGPSSAVFALSDSAPGGPTLSVPGIAAWVQNRVSGATSIPYVMVSIYDTTGEWSTPVALGTGGSPVVGIYGTTDYAFVAWVSSVNSSATSAIALQPSNIQIARYDFTEETWDTTLTLTVTDSSSPLFARNVYPALTINTAGIVALSWFATAASTKNTGGSVSSLGTSLQMRAFNNADTWTVSNWATQTQLTPVGSQDDISFPLISIDNTPIATGVNGQVMWIDYSQQRILSRPFIIE